MTDAMDDPTFGRRFGKPERRQAVAELQRWMTPAEMDARFDALSAISDQHFFLHGENQFMEDAHIAARFALARGASRVRLVKDPPDFEIEADGVVQRFEATEADHAGRKRGDEYKAALGQPPGWRHFDTAAINAEIAAVPVALRAAAELKAAKAMADPRYDPSWGLVILQNAATHGCGRAEIEACLEVATEPASHVFREVWVLWGGDAYRTWPQGGPRPAKPPREPPDFDLSEIFDGR
jgi:hypothetical protein